MGLMLEGNEEAKTGEMDAGELDKLQGSCWNRAAVSRKAAELVGGMLVRCRGVLEAVAVAAPEEETIAWSHREPLEEPSESCMAIGKELERQRSLVGRVVASSGEGWGAAGRTGIAAGGGRRQLLE